MSPTGAAPSPSFLDGASDHFADFVRDHPDADRVVARITFADSRTLEMDGFHVAPHATRPNCFLITDGSPGSTMAVVVRNDHVFKVEFEADPKQSNPFGFAPTQP